MTVLVVARRTPSDGRHDGDGGFEAGQRVRVHDDVRPCRFAAQEGWVAEVRRVVPAPIAPKLHRAGRLSGNGAFEIGVDFSSLRAVGDLRVDAWFVPWELSPVEGAPRRLKARRSRRRTQGSPVGEGEPSSPPGSQEREGA